MKINYFSGSMTTTSFIFVVAVVVLVSAIVIIIIFIDSESRHTLVSYRYRLYAAEPCVVEFL